MPLLACPSREELAAYCLGKTPDERSEEIDLHLEECGECRQLLETCGGTRGDTLLSRIGRPVSPEAFLDEPECREAAARVAALGREPSFATRQELGRRAAAGETISIGPYQLLEWLGAGGMGTVYKALHTRLKRVVALKLLPIERMRDAHALARFEREMEAVGRLVHPNIVMAHDAGETDGRHFLVMEYVEGSDLSALVRRCGPLPIADACELVRQAAGGLQHAHEHNLVHRDVKPSNLMLTPDGTVKVLDLGLALLADGGGDGSGELTGIGQAMGTPDYMAPEQGGDGHDVDIRADIYGLGATLYKLLTGESIYHGPKYRTPMQRLAALAAQPAPPIRQRREEIPEALSAVVHRMIARDPADRFATPAEAAEALAAFAAGADPAALLAVEDDFSLDPDPQANRSTTSFRREAVLQETSSSLEPPVSAVQDGSEPTEMMVKPRLSVLRRPPRGIFAGTVAAGLFGLIGVLSIFTFQTPQGTVEIELAEGVDAEAIEIGIKQGGKLVQIADAEQGWRVRLKDGSYDLDLRAGGDQLQLSDQTVRVTRGDRQVVRITLQPPEREGDAQPGPAIAAVGREDAVADVAARPPSGAGREPTATPPDPETIAETSAEGTTPAAPSPWQPTAEQQAFIELVAKLPAEEQVEAVRKKLIEVNPEFDGTVAHQIQRRTVTHFGFFTDHVTEIWPVRALAGLERLRCHGTDVNKGRLSDLTPLAGAELTELYCDRTRVADLSPLSGMPLSRLEFYHTKVTDLSPLSGMPLTWVEFYGTDVADLSPLGGMKLVQLRCQHTRVSDLSPLLGMPLRSLTLEGTPVSDLSPLAGMALTELNLSGTGVSDLSPLEGMPLTILYCRHTGVSDLSPLEGMRLRELYCDDTAVSDLSTLAGMPLTHLECEKTGVSDLSPLKGMSLKTLRIGVTRISDLSPLKGMPLTQLACWRTQVSDLKPLAGMPITELGVDETAVSELAPLLGMPLELLVCQRTLVSDLSPLLGTPLTSLCVSIALFDETEEQLVRSMKSLERVGTSFHNRIPVETFWTEHTERKEAAEEFAAATAKRAPDEQIRAVTARLRELNGGAPIGFGPVIRDGAVVEATVTLPDKADDITPLRGLTGLTKLTITGGPHWLDLSPVNNLPLEELNVDDRLILRNRLVLEAMPTLKTVNGRPAAEALAVGRD